MKNNRAARLESANQTIEIIEKKQYVVAGKEVDITSQINYSVENTILHTETELDDLLLEIEPKLSVENASTVIVVDNCTSMQAAERYLEKGKLGCLNFASAMNPGGGFLSGSQAQEESLSRASSLYATQMKHFDEMYGYNRNRKTLLYSDRMIYSPAVSFFKDDNDNLLQEPYCMDIVTSAAVNVGAIIQNNRTEEFPLVDEVMLKRLDKIFALFYTNGVDTLILGAWGCGVFRNKPEDVARYFSHFIGKNGKYSKCFNTIVFAVYDTSRKLENIAAFEKVFG